MALGKPHQMGVPIWQETFRIGPSVGLIPFRAVILDATTGTAKFGDDAIGKVKYPNTTFDNAENVIGVLMGPATFDSAGTPEVIAQNRHAEVRIAGSVPMLTDTTVDTTNILAGDRVSVSETATQDGMIKKTTLSTHAAASQEHVMGVALGKANEENVYILVALRMHEA